MNPTVDSTGAGTVRLFLWGTLDDYMLTYDIMSFDVNLHLCSGEAAFTQARFYNFDAPEPPGRRWTATSQGALTLLRWDGVGGGASFIPPNWGFGPWAYLLGDEQFDLDSRSMLLGYVDVQFGPGAQAGVFLADPVLASTPLRPYIYLGWGDDPVQNGGGQKSSLPEATIIPEPAALWLLMGCAAAAARRRHAG